LSAWKPSHVHTLFQKPGRQAILGAKTIDNSRFDSVMSDESREITNSGQLSRRTFSGRRMTLENLRRARNAQIIEEWRQRDRATRELRKNNGGPHPKKAEMSAVVPDFQTSTMTNSSRTSQSRRAAWFFRLPRFRRSSKVQASTLED